MLFSATTTAAAVSIFFYLTAEAAERKGKH